MSLEQVRGQRVAIVGGGLAGIAAAEALSRFPFEVHLFEAKRSLGGRAGAYRDPNHPSLIDRCQHVAMGCCTNFLGLCQRLELTDCFRRDQTLHFVDQAGNIYPFTANPWLPAPLHLAGAFRKQRYLTSSEQRAIRSALWEMAPIGSVEKYAQWRMLDWLVEQKQPETVIKRFWEIVLVSALGASLSDVAFTAARKVFVDGFLRHHQAYQLYVPTLPLQDVFDVQASGRLGERGVRFHRQSSVRQIGQFHSKFHLRYGQGEEEAFDNLIVAAPWHQTPKLFSPELRKLLPELDGIGTIESSPISSIHLWLDNPITKLPHAVLLDRTSQWVFNHGTRTIEDRTSYYYQVVISASHSLANVNHVQLAEKIVQELAEAFQVQVVPNLLDQQVVTEKQAVFAATPEMEAVRPAQATSIAGLALAGDWTRTGWPATMEGAVRSGYLAAEAILNRYECQSSLLESDLPVSLLSKLLWGLGRS